MALRIAREEYYLPLPMDSERVRSMDGVKDCFVPVAETRVQDWVLDELKGMGNRAIANGLVVEYNGMGKPDENGVEGSHRVAYSVQCGMAAKNGVSYLHLLRIVPVKFGLCWVKGKFYQYKEDEEVNMNAPTSEQMASVFNLARDLLVKHEIPSADRSQANPFLFAFIIPMTCQKSRVKAFANDLFHALHVLPEEESMDVAQANHYCAFDADREKGCYLVIFNHPAIFDYPEDSPEGRCAYGEWRA